MSSAASPGAGGQSPGHWTLTNNILWETVSSFLTMSSSNLKSGPPGGSLDMEDITYLMDMDGEGLCYHELYKSSEAFNKNK